MTDWQTGRWAAPSRRLDRERLPLGAPSAEAALQDPQARDVAQQSRGAADAALVREVVRQRRRRHDGRTGLRAKQRPGTGTEERHPAS